MTNFSHGSTKQHQDLVKQFQIDFAENFPDLMILPYTNGMFRDFEKAERIIHAGQKGVTDLLVLGRNWYLWFDGKTGLAKFSKEQMAFKNRLKEINGIDVVYKLPSISEGLRIVKNAKEFYEKRG